MRLGGFARPTAKGRLLAAAVALVGVGLGAGACAPPSPIPPGDPVRSAGLGGRALAGLFVGCWALTWDVTAAGSTESGSLPDSVSLRDGIVFRSGERLVSPATHPAGREAGADPSAPEPWEARYRLNRWWVEGDSLRIRFSDGGADEWLVSFGEAGESLGGHAASEGREARVGAAPIECVFGSPSPEAR